MKPKAALAILLMFATQSCVIKDSYPVERISRGLGVISSAHAINDKKGTLVFGNVQKQFGWLSTAWSHVDVVVFDKKGNFIEGIATTFSPSEVPNNQHGIIGRSYFSVRLPFAPPVGSSIKAEIHNTPILDCEFNVLYKRATIK